MIVQSPRTQFCLMGFTQEERNRVFFFEGVAGDYTRSTFRVVTDLDMARKYGIPIQELPLMCLRVLERDNEGARRSFTLSESDIARARDVKIEREEASHKRRPSRPPAGQAGTAWRS